MEAKADESGDCIFRISTFMPHVLPPEGLTFRARSSEVGTTSDGAMNEWLAASPLAEIVHGVVGCRVLINDMADRAPHALSGGDILDLGGRRIRFIGTPHVPHGWDAGVILEEETSTLFCGDLFTHGGDCAELT
jgi:hypothetical protein